MNPDTLVTLTIRHCVRLRQNAPTKLTDITLTNIGLVVNTIICAETSEHIITQHAIMVIDSTKS